MSGKSNSVTTRLLVKCIELVKKNRHIKQALYSSYNKQGFSEIKQHEYMLSCKVRINTYNEAIQKYVNENDKVVDLGTGTGVLSFFASKKKPSVIYSIDHGRIINLAAHLAKENGVKNIKFMNCHSSEFNPPEKADVIIQEQMGSYLFDEDMIRNVCDLRNRVLAPGGKILPGRFQFFVEPMALKGDLNTPFIWENNLHGIDFSGAKEWLDKEGIDYTNDNQFFNIHPNEFSNFLREPSPIFEFDLHTINPAETGTVFKSSVRVTNGANLDGFVVYFRAFFDDNITFQTGPLDPVTHWGLKMYRAKRILCKAGDTINLTFNMPDQTKVETWKIEYTLN